MATLQNLPPLWYEMRSAAFVPSPPIDNQFFLLLTEDFILLNDEQFDLL